MNTAIRMPTPIKNIAVPPINSPLGDTYGDEYAKFIEIAAHDLQAPLRKLGVLTDGLVARCSSLPGEEAEPYISRIHACIAEMRSLVDGFAELAAAIPAGMHFEPCDPAVMIRRILQEYAAAINATHADIAIEPLPVIWGDKVQLKQLFKKILDNSFKFSRQQVPLRICIRATEATDAEKEAYGLHPDQKFYRFSISDNGIGFSSADATNIFHPLARLHGKSSFPGHGLGLALVKRIADNHRGVVFAEGNTEGAGIILLLPENHH